MEDLPFTEEIEGDFPWCATSAEVRVAVASVAAAVSTEGDGEDEAISTVAERQRRGRRDCERD